MYKVWNIARIFHACKCECIYTKSVTAIDIASYSYVLIFMSTLKKLVMVCIHTYSLHSTKGHNHNKYS